MPICFAHKLTFYMIKSRVNLFYRENRLNKISLAKLFFCICSHEMLNILKIRGKYIFWFRLFILEMPKVLVPVKRKKRIQLNKRSYLRSCKRSWKFLAKFILIFYPIIEKELIRVILGSPRTCFKQLLQLMTLGMSYPWLIVHQELLRDLRFRIG